MSSVAAGGVGEARRDLLGAAESSLRRGTGGPRHVLVISHDGFNQAPAWRSVIVVPLTTSEAQARRGPTAIPVPAGTGGLKKGSVAAIRSPHWTGPS